MYTVMDTYKTQYRLFNWATVAIYVLTIIAMLGVSTTVPGYLNILRAGIQLYVGIFLLYRFHPFRTDKSNFSELDRKVAYTAGAFITMTTILGTTLNRYIENTKEHAKHIILTR
jgi:hypothetical protein